MQANIIYRFFIPLIILTILFSSCNQAKTASFPCDQDWGSGGFGNQISYSPDGRILGLISEMCVFFIDPNTQKEKFSSNSKYEIQSFAFSSDMKFIAMLSHDGTIYFANSTKGEIIDRWKDDESFDILSLSKDNKYVLTNTVLGYLNVWNVNSHQKETILDTSNSHAALVSIEFSPNGNLVAAGSTFGKIYIWDFYSGKLINTIDAHYNDGWVGDLIFTSQTSLLV